MKNIKCRKCGCYFKDRKDKEDTVAEKTLCWNCRFVWKTIGMMLRSLEGLVKVNRYVDIHLDDVRIRKAYQGRKNYKAMMPK